MFSSATDFSSASFAFSGPSGFGGEYNTADFLFSGFAAGGGSGANFSDVRSIRLSGNSSQNPGADFLIDFP
jgi:hypothetical protein